MRTNSISKLTELDNLLRKFSMHLETRVMKKFFEDYKAVAKECYNANPENELMKIKYRALAEKEQFIKEGNMGRAKTELHKDISELLAELKEIEEKEVL